MNDDYKKALGQAITAKRKAAGLNKKQLALMIGANRLSIRLIERGEANPTVDMLLKITRGLGVSLADIVVEAERALVGASEERPQIATPSQIRDCNSDVLYFTTKF